MSNVLEWTQAYPWRTPFSRSPKISFGFSFTFYKCIFPEWLAVVGFYQDNWFRCLGREAFLIIEARLLNTMFSLLLKLLRVLVVRFTTSSERQGDICSIGLRSVLRSLIAMPEFSVQGEVGNYNGVSRRQQTETGPSRKVNEWLGTGRNYGDWRECSSVTKSSYLILPARLLPRVCPRLPHRIFPKKLAICIFMWNDLVCQDWHLH